LSRNMFVQNFIKLSAAVNELSCVQKKNSAENITVRRYRADSKITTKQTKSPVNETEFGIFVLRQEQLVLEFPGVKVDVRTTEVRGRQHY